MKFHLQILSPEEEIFEGEVSAITLPTNQGKVEILPNHTPLISTLSAGTLVYLVGASKKEMQVSSGIARVDNSKVEILLSEK